LFNVDIQDFFKSNSKKIEIHQTVKDNKDNSINGLVFVLTDVKSVEEIAKVLRRVIE
jgi:hypothetical protein